MKLKVSHQLVDLINKAEFSYPSEYNVWCYWTAVKDVHWAVGLTASLIISQVRKASDEENMLYSMKEYPVQFFFSILSSKTWSFYQAGFPSLNTPVYYWRCPPVISLENSNRRLKNMGLIWN